MTHGSLFSGIGGFDLAAEMMGWENKFHCEWNPFGQKVLKYYWPEAESFYDITKTNFTNYANTISVLTGGFPCQPYSTAGKRRGKEDDRHLWPQMCRAIKEIKPRWVVGENVRGLLNWNGGLVFDEVCTDLENLGYQVASYLIPAVGVNAPHKRERIWIVAHSKNNGFNRCNVTNEINPSQEMFNAFGDISEIYSEQSFTQHTNRIGPKWWMYKNESEITIRKQFSKRNARSNGSTTWENFPTVPPLCDGNDGFPDRLDGITFSKWRKESIKAGGNAIVPQVAYQIFKSIQILETQFSNQ